MASEKVSVACVCWFMLVLSLSVLSEAQFFTKPASKSIPRMGRRSQESLFASQAYRHFLINNLLDNYGPNLMQALLKEQQEDKQARNNHLVYSYDEVPATASSVQYASDYKEVPSDDERVFNERRSGGLSEMLASRSE